MFRKNPPPPVCKKKRKRSKSKNTNNMACKDNVEQPGGELKWTPMFMESFAREWLNHPILLPNARTDGMSQKMVNAQICMERRELYEKLNISKYRPWTNMFLKEYKRMLSKKLLKARVSTTEQASKVLPEWVQDFDLHFDEIPKVLVEVRSRLEKSRDKTELLLDILRAMWKELKDNGSEGHKLEFWTRAINAASTKCGYPKILIRRIMCSVMKVAMQKLRLLAATGDRLPAAAGSTSASLTTADWLAVDLLLAIEPTETLLRPDSLTDYDQLATLTTLFSLAQMYQLDQCLLGTATDSDQRWKDATQEYTYRGFSSSMMVLQRRWCELVQLSRSKLAAFQRGGGKGVPVPPLCKQLAIRFPQLVTSPLPAWCELVASRRIVLPDYNDVDSQYTPGKLAARKLQTLNVGPKDDDIVLIEQDIVTIDLDGLDTDDEDRLIIDERIKLDKKKLKQRKRLTKEENDNIQTEKRFIEQRKRDMCNRLDSEMDSQLEYINDNKNLNPCKNKSTNVQSAVNCQISTDVDFTESDPTDGLSTLAIVDETLKTEMDITEHNILDKVGSKTIQAGIEKTIQQGIEKTRQEGIEKTRQEGIEKTVQDTKTTNAENVTPNLEALLQSSALTNFAVLELLDPSNVEAKIIFSDEEDEGTLNQCENSKNVTSQEAAIPKKQDELVTQQIAVKQENISPENEIISNNNACIISLDTDSSDSDKILNKIKTAGNDSINPKSGLLKKRIGPKSFMQKFQDKTREKRDSTDELLLVDKNNGSIPAKSTADIEGNYLSLTGTVITKEKTIDKDNSNVVIAENTVQIKTEPNDNNVDRNLNKALNFNKDKDNSPDDNKTKPVKKSSFTRFSFEDDKSDGDVRNSPIIPMEINKPINTDNNDTVPTKSKSNDAVGNEIVNERLHSGGKVILDKAKETKLDYTKAKTNKKTGVGRFSFEGEKSELNTKKTSHMDIDNAENTDNIPKPNVDYNHSTSAPEKENSEFCKAEDKNDSKMNRQIDYDGWIVIDANSKNNDIIPKPDIDDSNSTAALEEENLEFYVAENINDLKMECQMDYDGWIVIDGTQSQSSIGQSLIQLQIPLYKIDKLPFWRRHAKNNTINIKKISKNLNPVNGRRLKPGFRPTGWPKPVLRRKPVKQRYDPKDLRNNPDFNVGLKNFGVNFILKHATTYAICKPVTIDIERMPMDVLEEYLEKQNLPKQLHPRKKVELADIEEVRRINKRLLTAQVRPILAKKRSSLDCSRRQSRNSLSNSDSDVSFVTTVEPPTPTNTHPFTLGDEDPHLNTLTLQQLDEVLTKLTNQEKRRADKPKGNLYCCPARRHINYNRAKARIAARAGKHFASTINLHAKMGPEHANLTCSCCCVNVLRGQEESRKQLQNDIKALHNDLRSLAQIKNNENAKGADLSDAPPAKIAKPNEDPDYTPEEELQLGRRKSKDSKGRRPKTRETIKKKTKDDKNKSEKQKKVVETNEYEEWMRQRNICAKYFTMGATSPVAKRPNTTVTFKPPTLTKKTETTKPQNAPKLCVANKNVYTADDIFDVLKTTAPQNAPKENVGNENVLTADKISDVLGKRATQNTKHFFEQTNNENNIEKNIIIETPITDNSNAEYQQERQTEIHNIAEEHSYIKTPHVAIQFIPVSVASKPKPTHLTIVPMTSQQYDLADEDPMTIILNDKQPLTESESTSTMSEITPKASLEITPKASSDNTQISSSKNTLAVNSRTSSLEDLSEGVELETIPRLVIQNTNTQESKEKPPLVIKQSRVTNSQTGDIPRYNIDKTAAQGQKVTVPFSVRAGDSQKNQSETQIAQANQILFGNQAEQSNQNTFKQHIVTHVSGHVAGPSSQYWNNAITQPQIKALIETAQVNPGMKFMKVLTCPSKSETILATCVAKKEDPNQTTLRLITQRSNLSKKLNVDPECIDLTDNDEPALNVSQVDLSQLVQSANQPVKSIAQVSQLVRALGQAIPIPKKHKQIKIVGPAKQSVETGQPVQTSTQMNPSSLLRQSVTIAVSPSKNTSPVQSMDQVNKTIPPVQSMDQMNKTIPSVQSMDQVNITIPPVQSIDQVNKMIPPVQSIDQMKQIIQPIRIQANQIIPPIQTMSQTNQFISPFRVQTNQPIIQPILAQGNQMVQPIHSMGQVNQMVQPMQTMGQANQMVQPMQTMRQANQIVQPLQTMGQTNFQSNQANEMIQAVEVVEQIFQQQANQNIQPVLNMLQTSQFAQPVPTMGQPNQIIEQVVPGGLANRVHQPYGNIIKPLTGQPIELGIQSNSTIQPNPLTGHFILKHQANQPAQTTSNVGHESQTPQIVLNVDSMNNAGEVTVTSSVANPSKPIILNKYLNEPQRIITIPPWIKNQTTVKEDDRNILNHSLNNKANGNYMGGSMPMISDVVGNYDMESNTETVPAASFFDKPNKQIGLGHYISPSRVKVLPPKRLPRRKFTIGNRNSHLASACQAAGRLPSQLAQKRTQEQIQQSILELKHQLHSSPVAQAPETSQPEPTAAEDKSRIRKKKFESTDLSHGTPHYVEDIVKYILASKMSLSDVQILAVNTRKPLLKLRNQYIVVTESVSTNCPMPSFWTLNPPLNFSQIYFSRFGKSPNKVKKFNLAAELSKEKADNKPADSFDTGRLKVKAFAKLPGTENALTLNENIEVEQSQDEQNKLGKLLVDAQDFMHIAGKCFKKLSDDPLIYAQIFSVLSDVYRIEEHAIFNKFPLYLLDTAHYRLNPIQRREVESEGRRVIDLACPASNGTKEAMKDLVKLLNTPHDEFGFPRQKLDTAFTSQTVDDVTSQAVDDVTSQAVDDVTSPAVDDATSLAVDDVTSQAVEDVTSQAVDDEASEAVDDVTSPAVDDATTPAVTPDAVERDVIQLDSDSNDA